MSRLTILRKNSVQIGCISVSREEKRINEMMPLSIEECFLLCITLRMLLASLFGSELFYASPVNMRVLSNYFMLTMD